MQVQRFPAPVRKNQRMRRAPLFALPLLAAACAAGYHASRPHLPVKEPGRYVETLEWGGVKRRFILKVPKSYTGNKVPVVMMLHGFTYSAATVEPYVRLDDLAEKEGFVVVYPDGLGSPGLQGWNAGFIDLTGRRPDDLGFLNAVLDRAEGEIEIDRDREYVAGHSNGAFMANDFGAKLGGRLAAIASVAGTVGLQPGKEIPPPTAPLNVLLLHGTGDRMVGYSPNSSALLTNEGAVASARFWAKADGCDLEPQTTTNGRVKIDRYRGGKDGTEVELVTVEGAPHDWWGGVGVPTYDAPAADLIWEFFKNHPRKR